MSTKTTAKKLTRYDWGANGMYSPNNGLYVKYYDHEAAIRELEATLEAMRVAGAELIKLKDIKIHIDQGDSFDMIPDAAKVAYYIERKDAAWEALRNLAKEQPPTPTT